MGRSIQLYENSEELAAAAAQMFAAQAAEAAIRRGRFTVALSGGSTPLAMFALLARPPWRDRVPWPRVWVFWGDERCVPPDHPDSNYRSAHEALLRHVPVPAEQIQRFRGELDPRLAAQAYEERLRHTFRDAVEGAGPPARATFDLVFLGMGEDGHTASLFPDTAALAERHRWAVANEVPLLDGWRLTLTAPALNSGRQVAFLVSGAGKQAALREVLQGEPNPETFPSQLIDSRWGVTTWLLDQAAAAGLSP